jgi:protein-disulfide isomerase
MMDKRENPNRLAAGRGLNSVIRRVLLFALIAIGFSGMSPLWAQASESDRYRDVRTGFTDEGLPFIGDPKAPVTLVEFSDYLCPFCDRHFQQTFPELIEKHVRPGHVKIVFRDFPIASLHPQAPAAHAAALCVGEQGAALFWAMHDILFESRGRWRQSASTDGLLRELAESVGADMAEYNSCVESGRQKSNVEASVAAGAALGFNATPSFQFVGPGGDSYTFAGAFPVSKFSDWLDALRAGDPPPIPPPPPPPELPYWASEEGLAPDPERPGFTMAGDPYKGSLDAAVVVVEFSDFQCPSCKRHAQNTQPAIDKELIETGKVRWVFKNLPLQMHPNAPAAAAAAECAGDQGRFWEMKRLLFEHNESWSDGDPDPVIISLSVDADLDVDRFKKCFNSRNSLERVLSDIYDARGVVSETPSFITIYGGRGSLIAGTRDAEQHIRYLKLAVQNAASLN